MPDYFVHRIIRSHACLTACPWLKLTKTHSPLPCDPNPTPIRTPVINFQCNLNFSTWCFAPSDRPQSTSILRGREGDIQKWQRKLIWYTFLLLEFHSAIWQMLKFEVWPSNTLKMFYKQLVKNWTSFWIFIALLMTVAYFSNKTEKAKQNICRYGLALKICFLLEF